MKQIQRVREGEMELESVCSRVLAAGLGILKCYADNNNINSFRLTYSVYNMRLYGIRFTFSKLALHRLWYEHIHWAYAGIKKSKKERVCRASFIIIYLFNMINTYIYENMQCVKYERVKLLNVTLSECSWCGVLSTNALLFHNDNICCSCYC